MNGKGEGAPPHTPQLAGRRFTATGVCAVVVALLFPTILAVWGIGCLVMNGLLIRHERATLVESLASVLFSNASFIVMCVVVGGLNARLLEKFGDENRRASLRIGFAVVSGAVAGALASSMLVVSLQTGQIDAYRPPGSYWLWGPVLAVAGGMLGILIVGKHER
jgi:hypothetical protein